MRRQNARPRPTGSDPSGARKGIISVLAAVVMVALFAFVAFAVDTGLMVLKQTEMQNAVDAAALAASQEITSAVYQAGEGLGHAAINANSAAVKRAREMGAEVAQANGVFVDPARDVEFGRRDYDPGTGEWSIQWGAEPYNVVRVTAHRDNEDTSRPDGEVPLSFGWAVGHDSVGLQTSAAAFVEARDLVLVLDFSASMNDDSSLKSSCSATNPTALLDDMWNSLQIADTPWPGTHTPKFPSTGFGDINSYAGKYISSSNTYTIYRMLHLDEKVGGLPKYPFPQAGRDGNGLPKSMPNYNTSKTLWYGYIDHVKNLSGSYRKKYGYRTLMNYLQEKRFESNKSEDLWRTPHYPFHGIKEGASLFLQFLSDLDFGDEVGLVSYGGYSKAETLLNDGDAFVDISSDPITDSYSSVNTIQQHKQAGHYDGWTGMGYGIKDAKEMLIGDPKNQNKNGYARDGSRPTMIIMTDGQTNQGPSNWKLPSNWNWAKWTDYNNDGWADYTTSDKKKQYAFWEATEAIRYGVTVHTMSVGCGADRKLMEAIAFAGGGVWIDIPGGSTISAMEKDLMDAFRKIAASVPPAKLIYDQPIEETVSKGGPKGNNGVGNGEDPQPPGNPPINDGPGTGPGYPGSKGGAGSTTKDNGTNGGGSNSGSKGNNGVGNGLDPQPPGNPPINDGPGTGPGNPGNKGGAGSTTKDSGTHGGGSKSGSKGNNGVGNGLDPQPPGNPPINDGPGTGPGNPGNKGGATGTGGNSKQGSSGTNSGGSSGKSSKNSSNNGTSKQPAGGRSSNVNNNSPKSNKKYGKSGGNATTGTSSQQSASKIGTKGNNGVGNGLDPQPPGNPPVNDGPGTGPGNPGNKGGAKKNK